MQDILAYNSEESVADSLPFPIIADSKRELAVELGMLDPAEKDEDGMPLTARCVSLSSESSDPTIRSQASGSRLLPLFKKGLHHRPRQAAESCPFSTRPPPAATLTRSCACWTPSS